MRPLSKLPAEPPVAAVESPAPTESRSTLRQRLLDIGLSVITFLLVWELVSVGIFMLEHGGFFYTRARTVPTLMPQAQAQLTATERVEHRLHPYLGFVKEAGDGATVNNHGFPGTDLDFPFIKTRPQQFLIGVFGGSVAAGLASVGQDYVVQALRPLPALQDREIVLLNFAQGGYKQPQQLMALSYYLVAGQELDLVVNLDGFNEVALSARNDAMHVDVSMPSVDHMLPLANLVDQASLTPQRIEALARINRYKSQLNSLAQRVENAKLASVWFLTDQLYRIAYRRYWQEVVAYQSLPSPAAEDSLIDLVAPLEQTRDGALYDQIADQWLRSSLMMDHLLAGEGIPYIHILQPNQYYSGKTFTPEERRTALTEQHPYGLAAAQGYPYLLARAGDLEQGGVSFFSAVDIFDDEAGTIYVDDCCHFNERGYQILADFMADAVASTYR